MAIINVFDHCFGNAAKDLSGRGICIQRIVRISLKLHADKRIGGLDLDFDRRNPPFDRVGKRLNEVGTGLHLRRRQNGIHPLKQCVLAIRHLQRRRNFPVILFLLAVSIFGSAAHTVFNLRKSIPHNLFADFVLLVGQNKLRHVKITVDLKRFKSF